VVDRDGRATVLSVAGKIGCKPPLSIMGGDGYATTLYHNRWVWLCQANATTTMIESGRATIPFVVRGGGCVAIF
jgi:hypothetical protein